MIDIKTTYKYKIAPSSFIEVKLLSQMDIINAEKKAVEIDKKTSKNEDGENMFLVDFLEKAIINFGGISLDSKKIKYHKNIFKELPVVSLKTFFKWVQEANTKADCVTKKKS